MLDVMKAQDADKKPAAKGRRGRKDEDFEDLA